MHHYLGHMTYGVVNINGSLELSTFFLLSGFCLALKCGKGSLKKTKKFGGGGGSGAGPSINKRLDVCVFILVTNVTKH